MLISKTIDDALVEIGVKNPIDEASPQDHEYGLRTLNRIIDSYNTQNLLITYLEDIPIGMPLTDPLVPDVKSWSQSIEIGLGLQIDSQAPVDIQGLFWRQKGTDYQSKSMTSNVWSAIGWKTSEGIPRFHYIQEMDNNDIKIYFDMLPLYDLELHLLAKMPYTGKNSTGNDYLPTDDINWSFGFEKMLMLRLSVELCGSYSVEPSPVLLQKMSESENYVKAKNYQPLTLKSDSSLGGRFRRGGSSRSNRARY